MELSKYIDTVRNYPQDGVEFKDITPLLRDQAAFRFALDEFERQFAGDDIQYIAGIEARGFLFASALADRLKCGLIPIRKSGKLPGDVLSQEYDLEYGTAELEIRRDSLIDDARVLIIDDVLATGGTAICAANLLKHIGADIIGFAFLVSLQLLGGEQKLHGYRTVTLIKYD